MIIFGSLSSINNDTGLLSTQYDVRGRDIHVDIHVLSSTHSLKQIPVADELNPERIHWYIDLLRSNVIN